jgi:predicted ATPase
MAILVDFECQECGYIHEEYILSGINVLNCPNCGGHSKRIISIGQVYTGNQDTSWLRSVLEVVDKSNPARHVQEFIKEPNRRNYKKWMEGEGLRPLEMGEKGIKREKDPEQDKRIMRDMMKSYVKRHRIAVRG